MNNIQEDDWASESWGGHSGMGNDSDYSIVEGKTDEGKRDTPEESPGDDDPFEREAE
jgi:hypothetical protein